MNCTNVRNQLSTVECPSIQTPEYNRCLKEVISFQPRSKRDRLVSLIEDGCNVVVGNKIVVTSLGVSLSAVLLFVSSFTTYNAVTGQQYQMQSVLEEMEIASRELTEQERSALEASVQMDVEELLAQAKAAKMAVVYELDPRIPMRVVDSRDQSFAHTSIPTLAFRENANGRLEAHSLMPTYTHTESSASAFGKRQVFQYANYDGQVVMLDLADNFKPRSGIVLAGN